MNENVKNMGTIILVIGILAMSFSTVISIGYGLYLWGGLGGILSSSIWTAFLLWLKILGGGFLSILIGILLGGYEPKKIKYFK